MKKNKIDYSEIVVSRIVVMMFAFTLLSFLAWLYIIPFKKSYLLINNYYEYIEYATIAVTFLFALGGFIYSILAKRKSKDFSMSVITPTMIKIILSSAFLGAFIIPFSKNRVIVCKYTIMAFIGVFIAYAFYYLINKQFAFQTVICTSFYVLLKVIEGYYPSTVTFNDVLELSYNSAIFIFIGYVLLVAFIGFIVYKKSSGFRLWQTLILCTITLSSLIVRIFFLEYVVTVTTILLVSVLILLAIAEKIIKFK